MAGTWSALTSAYASGPRFTAVDTVGNALETAKWVRAHNYRRVVVVTSNYHMPRSLLLFHAAMPDIIIIAHPVTPESVKLQSWWQRRGTANLLVTEYNKYLFALLRDRMQQR